MLKLSALPDDKLFPYLHSLRDRSRRVEQFLGIQMPDHEADAVSKACAAGGHGFGAFYAWQMCNSRIAALLRANASNAVLDLVSVHDCSDYAPLEEALARDEPLIVAIPHHGHYVLAMSALIERIRAVREVMVFYADPAKRSANAVFDSGIANSHWSTPGSGVHVLHDDRAGLASALRGLRQGRVLVIMPDVGPEPERTRLVPFFGRSLPTMLGTATLSRKTGAAILPVSETLADGRLDFACRFAPPAQCPEAADGHASLFADYATTCQLFASFERLMAADLHRWQFCRAFFSSSLDLPRLLPDEVEPIAEALLTSSRADPFAIPAIALP